MNTTSPSLNLVVLRSSDMERAVGFYQQLGLCFTRHAHGNGPEHYSAEVGGLVFEIYPATDRFPPSTSTRVGFAVQSVDGVLSQLAQMGVKIIAEAADSEWGRRAVVKDWDGHSVELVERPRES